MKNTKTDNTETASDRMLRLVSQGDWKATVIGSDEKGGKAKVAVIIPGEGLKIKRIICEVSRYDKRDGEDGYNANLMAAAPDMMRAILGALNYRNTGGNTAEMWQKLEDSLPDFKTRCPTLMANNHQSTPVANNQTINNQPNEL